MKSQSPKGGITERSHCSAKGFGLGFGLTLALMGREEEGEEESKGSLANCEEHVLFHLAEAELIPESLNQFVVWEGCVHCVVAPDRKMRADFPNYFGKLLCNFMQVFHYVNSQISD